MQQCLPFPFETFLEYNLRFFSVILSGLHFVWGCIQETIGRRADLSALLKVCSPFRW